MHGIDPSAYILYVVYPQLDMFASEGVHRALSGFANIEADSKDYEDKMYQSYEGIGDDPSIFAEHARDQGIAYYTVLSELRQGIVNLLAVSLYHLFEQHRDHVKRLLDHQGGTYPQTISQPIADKLDELRLIANTAKHADGSSAKQLRERRPELFVPPVLRGSPLQAHVISNAVSVTNPLGGTDFFLQEEELQSFRDTIRAYWEEVHEQI